jgi:hypothetical protein
MLLKKNESHAAAKQLLGNPLLGVNGIAGRLLENPVQYNKLIHGLQVLQIKSSPHSVVCGTGEQFSL